MKIILPKFLCWLLTFNAVNIAWIFFRANSFESAMNIVIAMFTRRFDKPDCDIVRVLIKELKEEFPLWYKNKLWRKKKSKTAYLRSRFIAEFIELFIMMVKLKSIAKNFLFS